jgi:hypothetical protein
MSKKSPRAAAREYEASFTGEAGAEVAVKVSTALKAPQLLVSLDGEATIFTIKDAEALVKLLQTAIVAARIAS